MTNPTVLFPPLAAAAMAVEEYCQLLDDWGSGAVRQRRVKEVCGVGEVTASMMTSGGPVKFPVIMKERGGKVEEVNYRRKPSEWDTHEMAAFPS